MPDRRTPSAPAPMPGPQHQTTSGSGAALRITSEQGGRVVVASDALLAQLDSLGRLAEHLRLCAGSLVGVIETLEPRDSIAYDVPPAALEARRVSSAAVSALLTAQNRADGLSSAVMGCLKEYTEVERLATGLGHRIDEAVAWAAGAQVRLFALPASVWAVTGLLAASAITHRSPGLLATGLQDYLKRHGRILTSPASVAIIREMASDADGFGTGFLLVPPPIADALESTRITGVPSSSNAVVDAGRTLGLFEPTGEVVRKTSSFEFGTPPTSLVDRAKSFPTPETDPNGEQIRIDRYVEAGKPDRFDVYIAGTVTFDPKTGTQPFDLTSDLNGVGGQSSASYDAVVHAMRQAGVTPSSPVVLNGYSQGGLLAAQVAASGQFDVHGVVTFGAPSAQVAIPASIPVLTVRNAEDLVPATSGYDTNPHAVVVERPVFASSPVPSEWAVPAHRLSYYSQTASIVDESHSSEVRNILDPLNRFGAGATRIDSTLWVATRVPEGSVASKG
jgi:hypothetical protein